jgi:DNA-binding CsgD family transcriptional regulator
VEVSVREGASSGSGLLERESAVEGLEGFLRAVAQGYGGTAVVEGPPGIGKSLLLREMAERAGAHGIRVAKASGAELERELPFVVIRQLYDDLSHRVGGLEPDAVSRLLGGDGVGLLTPPNIGNVVTVLYRGVADFARREPLLFVIDDVQWADPDSVRALHFLARRISELPVGLLLGTRPSVSDGPIEDLVAMASIPVIRPAPLSVDASGQLISRLLNAEPTQLFIDTCHGVTNGNPLLLHELARELSTGGHPLDAEVVLGLGSASVARTALNRIGRLAPTAVPVARAVSVLGQRASTPRVARLAGLDLADATEVVAALVSAELLTDTVPLGWVHPLVAAALYRHTPAAERARLHAAAARLLEADDLPVGEVAAHLLQAEPAADPWVVERLRTAAYAAVSVGGVEHAIRLLRRALEEPAGDMVGYVLLDLGQLEMWTFDQVSAARHLTAAFDLHPELEARCGAAVGLSRLLALAGRWSEALHFLERALALLDPDDRSLVWLVLASERLTVCGGGNLEMDRYVERTQEIVSYADQGSHYAVVAAAHEAATAVMQLRPASEVRDLLERAWSDGLLITHQGLDSSLWLYVAWQLNAFGARDRALDVYRTALEAAQRHGIQVAATQARVGMAWLSLDAGDVRSAAEAFNKPVSDAIPLRAMGTRVVAAGAALCALQQGELSTATELLAPYLSPVADPPDRFDALVLRTRGYVHLAREEPQQAVACFERLRDWCVGHGRDGPSDWSWRADLALALARSGEPESAAELAKDELQRARAVGIRRVEGAALRALAEATPMPEREPILVSACETLSEVDPLGRASALVELAALRRRLNDQIGARDAASSALAVADQCGADSLRAAALSELHRLGARPRRAALVGVEALTAAERRVVELVSEGLTNREVALRLVVSDKTVEKHLSNAFRKLDVTQRDQLGSVLAKQ